MAEEKETVILEAEVRGEEDVENLTEAVNENKEQVEKTNKSTAELSKQQSKLAKASDTAGKGLRKVGRGFNFVGSAIKGAGIGLIVAVVAKLTDALSQNQAVADGVGKVFKTINIVFQQVTTALSDAFQSVGGLNKGFSSTVAVVSGLINIALAPLKLLFDGVKLAIQAAMLAYEESFFGNGDTETIKKLNKDIQETKDSIADTAKEAAKSAKEVGENFTAFLGEINTFAEKATENVKKVSVSAASESADAIIELRKQVELSETQQEAIALRRQRQAEQQRKERDDVRNSIEDRIRANNRLGEILRAQAREEREIAEERVRLRELELAQNPQNIEAQNALQEAKNGVLEIEERIEGVTAEQRTNEAALQQERKDNIAELRQIGLEDVERQKLEAEQELERRQEQIRLNVEDEKRKNQLLLDAKTEYEDSLAEIDKAAKDKEEERKKKAQEAKDKITEQELAAEKSRNDTINQLAEEGIAAGAKALGLGKEFAIAKALFDTFQSARAAFSSQLIPGDPSSLPRAIGAAVFATTAGLADVASIKSVKTPNVGGAAGGGGQSATAPQQPAFNLVGNAQTQGITQTQTIPEDTTTNVNVVTRPVTSGQEANRNAEEQSSF